MPGPAAVPLKPSAFLETVIAFLLPHFSAAAADIDDARSEIIDTLASYATRTRAELLQAAQIIALGMTTLDVLAEAKTADMSMSMRIRFRGCANGLNRAVLNTEKSLDRHLACDLPVAPLNGPADAATMSTVVPPLAAVDLHRAGRSTASHRPIDRQEQNNQFWAGGLMHALNLTESKIA